jgi:hypothetical protein
MIPERRILAVIDRDDAAHWVAARAVREATIMPRPLVIHALSVVDADAGDDVRRSRRRWLDGLMREKLRAFGPTQPADLGVNIVVVGLGDPAIQIASFAARLQPHLVVIDSSDLAADLLPRIAAPVLCVRPIDWRRDGDRMLALREETARLSELG